jgi:hypothetical protein
MLFTPNFLPCVAYFQKIMEVDEIKINISDIYVKQSYRTRATIIGPNKIQNLIVPVHASSTKTPIKEVKIDNRMAWQRTQLRTIEAAYQNSPYYQYYDYIFEGLFSKNYDFLIDLLLDSLTFSLNAMQLSKTICQVDYSSIECLIDFKSKHLPINCKFEPYPQNFGSEFVPNMSIVDLLFCTGPEAGLFLRNQTKNEQ